MTGRVLGIAPIALVFGGSIGFALVVVLSGYRLTASWDTGAVELAPAAAPLTPAPLSGASVSRPWQQRLPAPDR